MLRPKINASKELIYCLLAFFAMPVLAQVSASSQPLASYVDFAMSHAGNPAHGRELFTNELKAACVKCHTTDGRVGHAGPDLSSIGDKFPRRELVRSVLEPSSTIAIGYTTTIVETKSGEVFQGIVKQATDDWIELVGGDAKTNRIPTRNILHQRTSNISLMPEGLQSTLSLPEFADLIAYLETLHQTADTMTVVSIPAAATAATFRPLFHDNIHLARPTWFGEVPGRTNSFVVLEHSGKSWIIERAASGDTQTPLVDLSSVTLVGGGSGLLGMAFHPRFQDNHKYYVEYQTREDNKFLTLIIERKFSPDDSRDSGEPGRVIFKMTGSTPDHHGGCIMFGPDGYLYIATGDTGPQNDPQGHGQDMNLLLGKILRIDVDHAENDQPYSIPSDNPFRNQANVRPEIWASGFREPWRFSFDSLTHDLWLGDVGQDKFEEVDLVRAGENHGWNVYEGSNRFSDTYRRDGEHYIPPVFSYSHGAGVCITGGYVYRGTHSPVLNGWYLCADFESRRVWALTQNNRTLDHIYEIGRAPSRVSSFAQDLNGELYLVGYDSGQIYQLDLEHVATTAPVISSRQ